MPLPLTFLLAVVVSSGFALIAWGAWLVFCWKIAAKHGPAHLTKLPGIATAFRTQHWLTRLPSLPGKGRGAESSEGQTEK
ncbi:hypothetical protein [Streptomyces olivochromogenes]|uniref:hypothetical protein n=1 Tax=Streptomyces olivochromogenes TaxID=1963 RepID=UPI001F29BB0A|nr:hypothetical protein [Streptomyces olivochromogenes]MCF3136833.1 hypothetical protein [Streptomyces olivochromogenes]